MECRSVRAMGIALLFAALMLAPTAHAQDPGSGLSGDMMCGSGSGSGSADCCPTICEEKPSEPAPELTEGEAADLAYCYLDCLNRVRAVIFTVEELASYHRSYGIP